MSVAQHGEIHQSDRHVFQLTADLLQTLDTVLHPLELMEQLARFFAAAIADRFFQHGPQFGLGFDDGFAGLHDLDDERADE